MKISPLFWTLFVLFGSVCAQAQGTGNTQKYFKANYFRVWQGFSKDTPEQMLSALPVFMTGTVDLYVKNKALSNYIVIIPPKESPSYIPHELALVALSSESDYRRIRETAEGKSYSDAHWDVFNRANSKSAPFVKLADLKAEETLISNTAYEVLPTPINWAQGVNYVEIRTRRASLASDVYLKNLKSRLQRIQEFGAYVGIQGCIVLVNENYEVIYTNWKSQKDFKSAPRKKAWDDLLTVTQAESDLLMSQQTKKYRPKSPVDFEQAYHTR
ncbi:hypothetical protein [Pseudobdellovibrio exovorus]|uniref:ABM domain-containing protein n=1 Tax=Pseudobdellovibrio exovorus JSS TaxID=1184267 RepID=M4VD22_9BACT|nr:hypothetical protein [Pseudobdellovibrio exovorus]AGH96385.1 hypothetical protein A11Q_2169 [Pseudobdellovibrio exovorus JSS]